MPRFTVITATLLAALVFAAPASAVAPGMVGCDDPLVAAATETTPLPAGQYRPYSLFNLTASDPATTFEYVWDAACGASFTSVAGPTANVTVPGVDGPHVLSHRVRDTQGATPWRNDTVWVDGTAPVDRTNVPALSNSVPTTITVTGTDGGSAIGHVDYKLDNNAWVIGQPDGVVVNVTGEGVHTLITQVFDGAGNASAPLTRTVLIDTVAPVDTTSASAGWQHTMPAVDVTGTDNGSPLLPTSGVDKVRWQLSPYGTGSSGPVTTTFGQQDSVPLPEGDWVLKTQIVDAAGNASQWKTTRIKFDHTSPRITTPVASTQWRSSDYNVSLTGLDDLSGLRDLQWSIDGSAAESVPDDTRVTVKGAGTHTLSITATDMAGNSTTRVDTINIDNVLPTDDTADPGPSVLNHTIVPLSGHDGGGSGINHFEWRLDGGQAQIGATARIDGAGPHLLETQVVDNAGNASGWKKFNVAVDVSGDTTAPKDTTTTVTPGWHTAAVPLTISATDAESGVDHVEWRLDGSGIQSTPSGTKSASLTVSGDGVHQLETLAEDALGNRSGWRSQDIKIDTLAPADSSSLSTGWSNAPSVTISGTDTDPLSSPLEIKKSGVAQIEYQVYPANTTAPPIAKQSTTGSISVPVSHGTWTVRRRILDAADNASGWKTDTVKVDTIAPTLDPLTIPAGWVTALPAPLSGSDADSGVDHYEWYVDSGFGAPQTGAKPVVPDGNHTLTVRVVDVAGNGSPWKTYTVNMDATAPVNATVAPAVQWQRSAYPMTVEGSDETSGIKQIEWKLDDKGPYFAPAATASVTIAGNGVHKLESRIVDRADNASPWRTDMIGIDPDVPTLSANCGTADWRAAAAACSIQMDGGPSGRKALTVSRAGGPAQAVGADGAYRVEADGEWGLTIEAWDGAGNYSATRATVRVDRTKPTVNVTCSPDTGTGYVCTASAADAASGVAGVSYSVDGGAARPVTPGMGFAVAKGTLVVSATDRAGNATSAAPLKLATRTKPAAPQATATPSARSRTATVVLVKGGSVRSRMVGEIALAAQPTSTNVDVRPLTLGKGRYRLQLDVQAGRQKRSVRKTVTTRAYTPRITTSLGAAGKVSAKLTVLRRSGGRWVSHARGSLTFG